MIKAMADKGNYLWNTLRHLQYADGSLERAGLRGIEQCLTEDYGPKGHTVKRLSKDKVRICTRRFTETTLLVIPSFRAYTHQGTDL